MSRKAVRFLMADRKLGKLIGLSDPVIIKPRKDYFNVLVISIVYQQLSGSSAAAIYGRLKEACSGRITPARIASLSLPKMRKIGLSRQKISYIRDLSKKFSGREVTPQKLQALPDSEVISELVKIKGIGRWTAEMFLMFSLGREDVFPADDLGIKKAMQKIYRIQDISARNLDRFSQRWRPYRTYASIYLWKTTDTEPPDSW